MRSSQQRKSEFLGIPAGTAFARLRKVVLFNLLQKFGEDKCFRCQEKIAQADDLSIDHKQPWEGISIELFWELDNIAFSHLSCNLPHSYKGGGPRLRSWPGRHIVVWQMQGVSSRHRI